MITRIKAYLAQPYPFNSKPKHYLKIVAIFTGFVAFFLLFFQPFGIGELPGNLPYWTALGFAGVTFISMMFFLVLTLSFPRVFCDDNWTLGKDLGFSLINFLVIGHANYAFISSQFYDEFSMLSYSSMIVGTFAVGFFPYTFILLTKHVRMLNKNVGEASQMNQAIEQDKIAEVKPQKAVVKFIGENEGDELEVALEELLFVQSSGNYIEVVYHHENHVQKTILRTSLTNAEELLNSYPHMYRCHRKYLVNLDRIEEVLGNSQGYRLVMDQDVEDIPVARSKNAEFKAAMTTLHT